MILFLKKQHNVSINTLLAILLLSTAWQESSSFVAPFQQQGFTSSTPSTSSLEFSKQLSIEDRLDQLEVRLQRITEVSNYIEERVVSRGTVTTQGSSNSGSYLDGLKSQSSSQVNGLKTTSSSPDTKSAAPEGTKDEESIVGLSIPKLSNWRQLADGTIRGYISGSDKFRDGDAITTSPVHSIAIEGAVVKSVTGTRYYLDKQIMVMNVHPELNTNGAIMSSIPSLSNWILHENGSVSGVISGSTKFENGVRVSTSPLKSDAIGGTIVTSMSGSRYYLEELKEQMQR